MRQPRVVGRGRASEIRMSQETWVVESPAHPRLGLEVCACDDRGCATAVRWLDPMTLSRLHARDTAQYHGSLKLG